MPSTRRQRSAALNETAVKTLLVAEDIRKEVTEDDAHHIPNAKQSFVFDGVSYPTYQEMVAAKRKRNQEVLEELGFGDTGGSARLEPLGSSRKTATQRGIKKKQKTSPNETLPRRKSRRLSSEKASLVALDYYVNDWNRNNSVVNVEGDDDKDNDDSDEPVTPEYHKGRLNDGSDLTIQEAVEMMDGKWVKNDSVEHAQKFVKTTLADLTGGEALKTEARRSSPKSVALSSSLDSDLPTMLDDLSIDEEEWVAKVTPDRIYSVAAHPSEDKLIACAGDKWGYVGLWDVDASPNDNDNNGVSLFRVHSRPVCGLQWATHDTMISASYDGTVRRLNVEVGKFEEIFASYDDSDTAYAEDLGFGMDEGYRFWHQYVSLDHRYAGSSNPCLFLATSVGKAFHLDLRISHKQKVTFNEKLSEKKINTLSLHPNGHTLASTGNDGVVNLWDIRKFQGSKMKAGSPKPISYQNVGLSVSSSFFSPSGKSLLSTSFANKLDLIENPHTQEGSIKPATRIQHNNQTGRWLSTFMACWHPRQDIFVSGSLKKPRCVEIFNDSGKLLKEVSGESLTAVASRCCFHPSTNKLIIIGGNSSGRVVAIR